MKFEKNNRYFSIAVYVFITCLAIVIATSIIIKIDDAWHFLLSSIGIIYILLEPLIIGLVIAYLLEPIVDFYDIRCRKITFKNIFHTNKKPHLKNSKEKRWHTRTMPTLLTFITLCMIIGLFALMIRMNIEQISSDFSIASLKESMTYYLAYFEEMISGVTKIINEMGIFETPPKFVEQIYSAVNQFVVHLYLNIMASLSDIGIHAMNWLLAFVIAFYLLQDKERCLAVNNRILSRLLHTHYPKLKRFAKEVDSVFTGYIRGEVLDSIIMTILTSVALMFIQLDFAIIIGIISGIFNLIPYFGPIVGFALAVIIGLLDSNPMKAVYGAIAIIIIQQIDGWIIVPKIVGDCVKLHPVIVLLVILIGGNLFSLWGMLLAVPFTALIRLICIYCMPEIFGE